MYDVISPASENVSKSDQMFHFFFFFFFLSNKMTCCLGDFAGWNVTCSNNCLSKSRDYDLQFYCPKRVVCTLG